MNDEELKQRIAYLIEHGGIWDDPIADLRKSIRIIYALIAVALTFHVGEAVLRFI